MEQSVLTMTSSWLFDAYPLDKNGNTIRLEDSIWSHSIYVVSDNNYTDLLKSN
jgi:hypothetical protein